MWMACSGGLGGEGHALKAAARKFCLNRADVLFPSVVRRHHFYFSTPMSRQASISRKTQETSIEVSIDLDCAPGSNVKQVIDISTGIGFLDHVCPKLFDMVI